MDRFFARKCSVLLIVLSALLMPMRMYGVGFIPTDGGLAVDLKENDKILLAVEIDGTEYFVCHYPGKTGGKFNYTTGNYLKLFPQAEGATEPSPVSVWTISTPLTRIIGGKDYSLGGICYTMWSSSGYTLQAREDNNFKHQFLGNLSNSTTSSTNLCDVVFIIPTNHDGITSFDPDNTLGRNSAAAPAKGRFDGRTGTGFLGMTYREVYMLNLTRTNSPYCYTNASLVTFNTSDKQKSWSEGQIKCDPGRAAYAYADNKHKPTTRTLFHLYILNEPINSCSSYFFATDEQSTVRYRQSNTMSDSTAAKTVYTMDRLNCMEQIGETKRYQTGLMKVPTADNSYYYVGYNNNYCEGAPSEPLGEGSAVSDFTNIRQLPMDSLAGKKAPAGACGRMVANTASSEKNLDVKFHPAGYFLKVSTGTNVPMRQTGPNEWTSSEMWTISDAFAELYIKATLMTGPEFSKTDPGADIDGWSVNIQGKTVKVADTDVSCKGKSGWARIHTNNTDVNGHMEFIVADLSNHIYYNNNGFLGVQVPNTYPAQGSTTVKVDNNRLKDGYTFTCWNTQADGNGVDIPEGTTIDFTALPDGVTLSADSLILYAKASYEGTYQIALSFIHPTDGKRYFLTHPGTGTPRYARARHYDDWTNVWQGMANADNVDPDYLNTFELRYPIADIKKKEEGLADLQPNERVLDPRRYTLKGYEDSLMLYENFSPAKDEYIGLYYISPNTILANNTWAGLFTTTSDLTTSSWPDFEHPYISSAKLQSIRYVNEYAPVGKPDSLILRERGNKATGTYVKYIPSTNQFDGCVSPDTATEFQITAMTVADAHYVVLPDTTKEWRDEIVFGQHQGKRLQEDVWSALIGKQLMACMIVDGDTVYFHPNRNKIFDTPEQLYLSSDFRLSQEFTFIPDSRFGISDVAEEDRVSYDETSDYWHYIINSGNSSPIFDSKRGDIVDTFRIRLIQGGISKIKDYRGRWKNNAPGLKPGTNGSRYRDVLLKTKTYYYGAEQTKLVLTPEEEDYTFNPLEGNVRHLNFTLERVTYKELYDSDDNLAGEYIVRSDTITDKLKLQSKYCSFKNGSHFNLDEVHSAQITMSAKALNNDAGDRLDTLTISKIDIDGEGEGYTIDNVRIPLRQTTTEADELIWSVEDDGKRYYIMAGSSGFIFRQFDKSDATLYKVKTKTHLIVGSNEGDNSDGKYITPWSFSYAKDGTPDQLAMKTKYGINKYFCIITDSPTLHASDSSLLTYSYVHVYVNENANEEEQVRLKYVDKWLKFTGGATPSLSLVDTEEESSVFSWSYLEREYNLQNNGNYPSQDWARFGYNTTSSVAIQTRYKAYRNYSMMVGHEVVYLCKEDEADIADLKAGGGDWRVSYSINRILDSRFDDKDDPSDNPSGLSISTNETTLTTTITPSGDSPTGTVDIVDTLDVRLLLLEGAPAYRFKGDWKNFKSVEDARLKIPLVRKVYHTTTYDSLVCIVEGDEHNHSFPATLITSGEDQNDVYTFYLSTIRRQGTRTLDMDNNTVAINSVTSTNVTVSGGMDLDNAALAEVRLADEYGNSPAWCKIDSKGDSTITVQCLNNGIRSPRSAYIYLAYIVEVGGKQRFVNFRLTVSQPSHFDYANNQVLVPSKGASGDTLVNGEQQVHENKRILYYYPEQDVELPVRERNFYGWWRWYNRSTDADIPNEDWRMPPRNVGAKNFPFRIIGDSVWTDETKTKKKLVTMGRYTVFHYPSKDYDRRNAPSKSPRVAPPITTFGVPDNEIPTVTYAVDISNYYDNLPLQMKDVNQVDTAVLDTMRYIIEPTLSLREVFELRPWTEMAEIMENYKDTIDGGINLKYMEDHEVMAPIGNRLLLRTEQRYIYEHFEPKYDEKGVLIDPGHSESLLGYYMRDDNWATWSDDKARQDTMIWCGGWDADCEWYIFHPEDSTYTECTYSTTESDDFLDVPGHSNIPAGKEADTVYYCLRARSKSTTGTKAKDYKDDVTIDGLYWFNICRYMVIYHRPTKYGPKLEADVKGVKKALITNDEIEQNYEVLERLNFDYNKPGSEYTLYPHPLPWADASYGFTYPTNSGMPHNRWHKQADFPNMGEYGLINYIKYDDYWYKMAQHGGAENGYMIYCDGMSSAGQVAALTLNTQLCEGQKMYFSGYVGNCSKQSGKSKPSFTFSVQGSTDGSRWEDITSYMTGDLPISSQWYQIFFPINLTNSRADGKADYSYFRVRIYNVSSDWDGNDFVIDDMCLFATKPPLIAYQANTKCVENSLNDSITQVVLRIDYQGFSNDEYNGKDILYTIEMEKDGKSSYVSMDDRYLNQRIVPGKKDPVTPDTIYGIVHMPLRSYVPTHEDSIFSNIDDLIYKFEQTADAGTQFKQGYVFENVDGKERPVMYVVHVAKMTPDYTYRVRMSTTYRDLLSSICAMTSEMNVSNRMVLDLNGEEQPGKEVVGMCANTTYDISMRAKGTLYLDNSAPIDLDGSCQNDWLLYGDTVESTSEARYGYKYHDIVKVVKDILRAESTSSVTNENQFATNLSSVSRNTMIRIQNYIKEVKGIELSDASLDPYTILSNLVNNGFLTLYKSKITATLMTGDSLKYVVFPILGTGSDAMHNANVDVCPNPVLINIKPEPGGEAPMILGGINRDSTQRAMPMGIIADNETANSRLAIRIDSINSKGVTGVAVHSIELREWDDPEYLEGIHTIQLLPDKEWIVGETSGEDYYKNGDTLYMRPAEGSYHMRGGYTYTFNINLMTRGNGRLTMTADPNSCRVGVIPLTISVVPDFIRWNPKSKESNTWNNPDNWIGVDAKNVPLHDDAHFAPLTSTSVIIPAMEDGMPYPVLPDRHKLSSRDSVKQIGFEYNSCDVIRFLPGAAMANQQQMSYNEAVVDLSTPHGKWALRSAPVKGVLGGDIYMANADVNNKSSLWEAGTFDANGRDMTMGNASFWISMFSSSIVQKGNGHDVGDSTRTAAAEWSRPTNDMTIPLPYANGWAVYTKTASEKNAAVRLPKKDDIYYYYNYDGDKDGYENNLQSKRDLSAGGADKTGKLAFNPVDASENFTLNHSEEDTMFVFGNPTMGYIDIWGFISDNNTPTAQLVEKFDYIDAGGTYRTISKDAAENVAVSPDTINNVRRYLPPMHAIVLTKTGVSTTSLTVRLDSCRVLTSASQKYRPSSAPRRVSASGLSKGIMTVTAINPVSPRCTSRLLIGQGYHNAVRDGEDAILTTVNINKYSNTSAPATPFNIYASEGDYGLSIDLRDEVVYIPVSFYMSELPYDAETHLWFTGVNNIDGELVFYDALTGSERTIIDGIRITIPTPEKSHETRYYICRRGFDPNDPTTPVATDIEESNHFELDGAAAVKIINNGHVLILRDGHVYTMFGQKLR